MKSQKLLEDEKDRLLVLSLVKEIKTFTEHLKIQAKFPIQNGF